MTLQHIYETAKQIFPQIGETQIVQEADRAQKELARDTEILETTVSLSSPSTNVVWSLPSDFLKVERIDYYDSSDNPLYVGNDIYIDYEVEQDKIFFRGTNSTNITGLPSDVSTVYLRYSKLPLSLSNISSSLSIDEQYHEGVLAKVMERLYARFPTVSIEGGRIIDWRAVDYWKGEYNDVRLQAKRDKNNKTNDDINVVSYPHGGDFYLQKRVKDSSGGSVAGTLVGFSKYVKITATSPSTVSVGTPIGFSSVSASESGGTISVTTSAEFSVNTFVVPNQNINYSYISSSQIDLYPPSNWGTLVVEIYER